MTNEIPQVVEINCETGEAVYRDMTEDELAKREEDRVAYEAEKIAIQAERDRIEALKVSARTKLITGSPLTEEEAALLVL
jgi:hypothetical protein